MTPLSEPAKVLSRIEPLKEVGAHTYHNVTYYEAYLHRRHITAAFVEVFGDTTKPGWRLDVERTLEAGAEFTDGVIAGLFDSDGSICVVGCARRAIVTTWIGAS